jgi:uncharacterized protein YycO
MIRLRFVAHPGIFDALTKFAQYGFWATHCEIVVDGGYLGARLDGGVRVRPVDYDAGKFSREEIVAVPATDVQERCFLEFAFAQLGKPYDWSAIAAFYVSRDWQDDRAWWCSELTGASFVANGMFRKPENFQRRFTVREQRLLASTMEA